MSIRILCAAMIAAFALSGAAMAEDPQRLLTVTGEGRVSAPPDMATVRLGVFTSAPLAAEAMAENSAQIGAVIYRLSALGIGERDIQTTDFSVNPRWQRAPDGEQTQDGFEARNMLVVRVRDTDRLGEVLDAAAEDGANTFQGLTWGIADPQPVEDAARKAAVAEARRKAEIYAGAAGETLGALLSLSEAGSGPVPIQMESRMSMMADQGVPVASGELDIRQSVTLVYALD